MANGLPLASVVGRREYMREFEEIFVSSTFGGDTLALAACQATLDEYDRRPVVAHQWQMGRRFQEGVAAAAGGSVCRSGASDIRSTRRSSSSTRRLKPNGCS